MTFTFGKICDFFLSEFHERQANNLNNGQTESRYRLDRDLAAV